MSIEIDPEGNEIQALQAVAAFDEKRILEVGSGDGRLTWRYADKAGHVTAIDPDEKAIEKARRDRPIHLEGRVDFEVSVIEDFVPQHGIINFDIVIFSWSLACIVPENMYPALKKARKTLAKSGTLINIQEVPHTRALELHAADRITPVGSLRDGVNFEDIKLAQIALSKAIDEGLFTVVDERVFEGYVYGSSLDVLMNAFPGTLLEEEQVRRVESVISQGDSQTKVTYRASVQVIALKPEDSRD